MKKLYNLKVSLEFVRLYTIQSKNSLNSHGDIDLQSIYPSKEKLQP